MSDATPRDEDDLPQSPSGRIPQWVRDEAARPHAPRPDPGPAPPPAARPEPGATSRPFTAMATPALLAVLLALAWVAWSLPGGAGADRPHTASPINLSRALPPAGSGASATPLGTPESTSDGDLPYRFASVQTSGEAVTWDPCRAVHVVIDASSGPADGMALLRRALTRVSRATGLQIVVDGPTSEIPSAGRAPYQPRRYGPRWAPVLISWTGHEDGSGYGADAIGTATPHRAQRPSGDLVYVTGQVLLDPDRVERLRDRAGGAGGAAAVDAALVHVLAHLFGLSDVDDDDQLMGPNGADEVRELRGGDQLGLALLGRGACAPDL